MRTRTVCDFCGLADPGYSYPARDFVMATLVTSKGPVDHHQSEGDWLACAACADLIEHDDYEGLTERSVERMYEKPITKAVFPNKLEVAMMVGALHENFRAARTGAARTIL
jgi:hypothetical protein